MQLSPWRSIILAAFVLFVFLHATYAQKNIEMAKVPNTDIACAITIENSLWQPNSPALVRGVVTNVSQHPAAFMVEPTLLLTPKSPEGDSYWSPVDIFRGVPLGTITRSVGKQAQTIQPRSIPLKFSKGAQEIQFQIDASSLFWAKQISSVWPSQRLFSAVSPGAYSLTLLLGTNHGDCETPRVDVTLRTTSAAN